MFFKVINNVFVEIVDLGVGKCVVGGTKCYGVGEAFLAGGNLFPMVEIEKMYTFYEFFSHAPYDPFDIPCLDFVIGNKREIAPDSGMAWNIPERRGKFGNLFQGGQRHFKEKESSVNLDLPA